MCLHASVSIEKLQVEQQEVFWLTGWPRICTVGGLALPMAGWLAILKLASGSFGQLIVEQIISILIWQKTRGTMYGLLL